LNFQVWAGVVSEWLGVVAVTMLAGTSARFKSIRPVAFVYPRREGILSLYIFSLILVLAVLFYTPALNAVPLVQILGLDELSGPLDLSLVCLLPFLLALIVRKQPALSTGWSSRNLNASLRLGLALVFLAVFLRGALYSLLDGVTSQEIQTLLLWIGIALAEETIFRGYLQTRLANWLGKYQGWILTALLFTLWNTPRFMLYPHPGAPTLVFSLAFTFFQGLLLGWIYLKNGHVAASGMYRAVSEWIFYLA
jgi:membrane protease YdiL (CAAX protease family)